VFRAVYTEVGARLQSEAMRLRPVTFLSEEETAATTRTVGTQIDRSWFLWLRARADAIDGGVSCIYIGL
jgi:hypothetical protein